MLRGGKEQTKGPGGGTSDGINNGVELEKGLGVGTGDGPGLAEGLGAETSDSPELDEGQVDGAGMHDGTRDGMSA